MHAYYAYLVPILRLFGYAKLQQHQLLMLANPLPDAKVYTLTAGSWVLQLYIIVLAR